MAAPRTTERTLLRGVGPMIFVTVGAQMPFDRLIRTVDEWAGLRRRTDVFAQIGPSNYHPKHFEFARFLDPIQYRTRIEQADTVVAHAGMGSIITALELGKPIIVMPRRGDFRETRNDHQVATAKYFGEHGRIIVAFDDRQLIERLDNMGTFRVAERIDEQASSQLISTLRAFIEEKNAACSNSRRLHPLRCDPHQPISGNPFVINLDFLGWFAARRS